MIARDELNADDAAILERLAAIAAVVDPVPDDVVEVGKAAFSLRHPELELLEMVSRPPDLSVVRSTSATSHLHFFEHDDVSIDVEVTVRGGFAAMVGVVTDARDPELAGRSITVETAGSSTTVDLVDGRFTVSRLPLGLVRVVLSKDGHRAMSTRWFELG